jgi:pyruvate dehydrogenase E2 component (dihydrolipoamide acetyltransferase)
VTEKNEKILVPDIGGAKDVVVIEVHVSKGDQISVDDSLITIESDKASMDIPASTSGKVEDVKLKVGDKVSEGSIILLLKTAEGSQAETSEKSPAPEKSNEQPKTESKKSIEAPAKKQAEEVVSDEEYSDIHAGPAVRRIAQELNIDLRQIKGSGEKNRILKEDLKNHLAGGASVGVARMPAAPSIDFSRFGEVETKPLSKIKKATAVNLSRSWVTIPHVTQFDEADVTELENFRQSQKKNAEKNNVKLTPIAFIMKAVVAALKEFPQFNSSLDSTGENLILKKYFHLGVAVETPNGLVVPVIRDVDKKGVFDLAKELVAISAKARDSRLSLTDLQGACFSISSLGGIGGTGFTPIINAPEVAILGVSKSQYKPVYQDNDQFSPRLMMPLSLSYDHRVIDGAEAARFIVYLAEKLSDIRTLLL